MILNLIPIKLFNHFHILQLIEIQMMFNQYMLLQPYFS